MEITRTITYNREDTHTIGSIKLNVSHAQSDEPVVCNVDAVFAELTREFMRAVDSLHGINDTKPATNVIDLIGCYDQSVGDYDFAVTWQVSGAPATCVGFGQQFVSRAVKASLEKHALLNSKPYIRTTYW